MKKRAQLPNLEWKLRIVVLIVGLMAAVSLLRLSFNLGYYYHAFECATIPCAVSLVGSFLACISLGLIISTMGLALRNVKGLWLSCVALTWTLLGYLLWYRGTLIVMRQAEVEDFSFMPGQMQHLLTLIDATWWDLIVLSIAVFLFVWHLKLLFLTKTSEPAGPELKPASN